MNSESLTRHLIVRKKLSLDFLIPICVLLIFRIQKSYIILSRIQNMSACKPLGKNPKSHSNTAFYMHSIYPLFQHLLKIADNKVKII